MKELGEKAIQKDRLLAGQWDSGQFPNYGDWCDASLRVMLRQGLNRRLFERVMKLFSINDGVFELVADLRRKDIHLAIVSGGFYEQARSAQEILGIRHCYAAVDLSWNTAGDLASWNLFPSGPKGKLGFLRLIAESYAIDLSQCAYVTDNIEDVAIMRSVGVSFAYNNSDGELAAASTCRIKDFKSVSNFLGI
jgi:phosphoserine phosphatase